MKILRKNHLAKEDPMNEIEIGKKIDAKDLFDAIKNSGYMTERGYKILYARKFHERKTEKTKTSGVEIKKSVESNKIIGYGFCFHADAKELKGIKYVHLRINSGVVSAFSYTITMGNENEIEEDLVNLANLLKSSRSNSAKRHAEK